MTFYVFAQHTKKIYEERPEKNISVVNLYLMSEK